MKVKTQEQIHSMDKEIKILMSYYKITISNAIKLTKIIKWK